MSICTVKVSLRSGAYADGPWEAVIEIDSFAVLEELHYAIQGALGFDNDHLYEFFIAKTERSRDRVRFDDDNGYIYERTIESLHPLPDKKSLYYLFDYGDDWLFKVAKINRQEQAADPLATYQRVVREAGTKPTQYPHLDEDA